MKILDCESIDSTFESMDQILGAGRSELESVFNGFDFCALYEEARQRSISPEEVLFTEVMKTAVLGCEYDETRWFHLTRVPEPHSFERGLLPLPHVVDGIWTFLFGLIQERFSEASWLEFKTNFEASHALYKHKMAHTSDWGPCAVLVREFAFRGKEAQGHDYLRTPEIVEDICTAFEKDTGVKLLSMFEAATKPCIVKFSGPPQIGCVRAASYYLYTNHHSEQLSVQCNTCYMNGNGEPISAERILKIDYQST